MLSISRSLLLAAAVVAASEVAPGQSLQSLVTYTGADPQYCNQTPQQQTTIFTSANQTVNAFFVLNGMNVAGGDTVQLYFYGPSSNGNLSVSTKWNPTTNAGYSTLCFADDMSIDQWLIPYGGWGQWQLQVIVNGNAIGSRYSFQLNNSSAMSPNYTGSFDAVDCSHIYGWAEDFNRPTSTIGVNISVDGNPWAMIAAGDSRSDLTNLGIGNHAWNDYSLPANLHDGNQHWIQITYPNLTPLPGSPKSFQNTCTGTAEGTPAPPNPSAHAYSAADNPYYEDGSWECTRGAWGRAMEKLGIALTFKNSSGTALYPNAADWFDDVVLTKSITRGTAPPQPNSIIVWQGGSGSLGHVGFVETVNPDGSIVVSESNYPLGSVIHEDTLYPSYSDSAWQINPRSGGTGKPNLTVRGYIYLAAAPNGNAGSANLQVSLTPSYVLPTANSTCRPYYQFTLSATETNGVGINLQTFGVSAPDYSWQLPALGVPTHIAASGTFTTSLSWCRGPGTSTWTITGVDDHGNTQTWSAAITYALQ